ncbi:hypothetical protein MPSEU_000572700 [Mayamaea pseudoterrestris]|nr:hypothetical protein MPSEU_000572700 [Mayamaea pseudoterrestris]
MNCKEHHIPELELSTGQVREALQCILHTILFIRSPGPVKPSQVECEGFRLTYTRISATLGTHAPRSSLENDLDQKINQAIETFLRSLSQIGPELLSGCLTLSFLERRASRQLFGLMSHEEKVVFEQWVIRIVVNNTPRPIGNDSAAVIERQRIEVRIAPDWIVAVHAVPVARFYRFSYTFIPGHGRRDVTICACQGF